MLGELIKHRVILGSILIVAISAIIIERALNDLVLDYLHPIAVLGLGILVFAMAWIFATRRPVVPFWALLAIGGIMVYYGWVVA